MNYVHHEGEGVSAGRAHGAAGDASGIIDMPSAQFGTKPAGNSVAPMPAVAAVCCRHRR